MTLLYILAFLLLCVALNQLFKVVELSRDLKSEPEWHPNEHDNRMMGRGMLIFVIAFMWFFVWQLDKFYWQRLPISASEHGVKIDWLLDFNYWIVIVIFVFVNIFLFGFAWKYYGRPNHRATFFHHSKKLEMIWTTIPAIGMAIIIVYGLKFWNEIMELKADDPDPVKIELYAKQFDWTARYAGKDGKFGIDDYMQITGTNPVGIDTNDASCNDDILVKNEFHIPVNKEVIFQFRSRDVIHSAFMPHFRAQMNCVPGQITAFRFKPILTSVQMRKNPHVILNINEINRVRVKRGDDPIEFDYLLLCNKICGASHYNMQMKIVVDEQIDYDAWLAKQKTFKTVAEKN